MKSARDIDHDVILERLSQTAPFDWQGQSLEADDVTRALRAASERILLVALIILAFPLSESFQRFADVLDRRTQSPRGAAARLLA